MDRMSIRRRLESMADPERKKFSEKLTPGVDNMLGLSMPSIREMAREIAAGDWRAYSSVNDCVYHEETMLRGLAICYAKVPFGEKADILEAYVSDITDWMQCDSVCSTIKPKKSDWDEIWDFSVRHLSKEGEFEKRFGAVMLMRYIDSERVAEIMRLITSTDHPGYYWKMGAGWALAECCVKHPDMALEFLRNNEVDSEVLRKTVRKVRESFRASEEMKETFSGLI